MGMNVAQVLRQGALLWPSRVALIDCGNPAQPNAVSYAALDAAARQVAGALSALGLGPGDRVALMAGNSDAFAAAWFGAVYAGCAIVPIPVLSAPPEVAFRVRHPGARALLVDAARSPLAQQANALLAQPVPLLDVHQLAAGEGVQGTPAPAPLAGPVDGAPEDTAMVLYTSGTTGSAKGAAISHAALLMHTAVMAHHTLRLGPDDVVAGVLPLTHSYGCRMVMLASFFAGARCLLLPRFDAAASLASMCEHGVSWLPGVPTMFAAFGNLAPGAAPERLRWCLSAGAPLADEVVRRAEARLGAEVRQGFGMTEATFISVNAPPDARVVGSVGRPVWGIEVAIVDADNRPVAAGEDGQVIVRGHNMMSGYLDDPAATAQVLADGFMHTGDVGRLDPDGRLYIVDRLKDLIIRGGNNVYPSEVEDALASHPQVAEVAVVGRPHDYYGEEVVAVVVARGPISPSELGAWAAARVAKTKVPRELVFVDALPLGPSGKVLKRALRAQLTDGSLRSAPIPKA